jgi:DNA-nicking Smr family endonuclease
VRFPERALRRAAARAGVRYISAVARRKKKRGLPLHGEGARIEAEGAEEGLDEPLWRSGQSPAVRRPAPIGTSLREVLRDVQVPEPPAPARLPAHATAGSARSPAPPPTTQASLERPDPSSPAGARPSQALRGEDRIAYLDALAGVRPLRGRAAVRIGAVAHPPAPPADGEREGDAIARARLGALIAGGVRFDVHREEGWIQGLRRDQKPAVLGALRRARIPDADTLDLHGVRAADASERVTRFVREAHRAGVRRVRIVHGKGLHSEGGGVLADIVVEALTAGATAARTIAFVTAPPEEGGAGALLVELARR